MTARRAVVTLAVSAVLVGAGCSGSSNPDPGAPGAKSELNGGGPSSSSTSSTASTVGGGGGSRGATSGNQILPGETTLETSQTNR